MNEHIIRTIESDASLYEVVDAIARFTYNVSEDGIAAVPLSYIEAIEAAQKHYNEVVALSEKEIAERAKSFNDELETYQNPSDEEIQRRNSAVAENVKRLDNWKPSTYELRWLKQQAYDVLLSSKLAKVTDVIKPLKPEEWHKDAICLASGLIQQAISVYERELKRVNEINKILDELRDSFTETV